MCRPETALIIILYKLYLFVRFLQITLVFTFFSYFLNNPCFTSSENMHALVCVNVFIYAYTSTIRKIFSLVPAPVQAPVLLSVAALVSTRHFFIINCSHLYKYCRLSQPNRSARHLHRLSPLLRFVFCFLRVPTLGRTG